MGRGLKPVQDGQGYNAPQYKAAAWMPTSLLTHIRLQAPSWCIRLRLPRACVAGLWIIGLLAFGGPARADDYEDVNRLLRAGNPTGALTRADAYLQDHPRDPQMLFLRGSALADAGRTREAEDALTRLTQDFPELPEPYNNLAVLRAAQGRLDEAQALLLNALRTRPNYAIALENLGDVQARLALRAWQQAQQADPALTARTGPKSARVRQALGADAASAR